MFRRFRFGANECEDAQEESDLLATQLEILDRKQAYYIDAYKKLLEKMRELEKTPDRQCIAKLAACEAKIIQCKNALKSIKDSKERVEKMSKDLDDAMEGNSFWQWHNYTPFQAAVEAPPAVAPPAAAPPVEEPIPEVPEPGEEPGPEDLGFGVYRKRPKRKLKKKKIIGYAVVKKRVVNVYKFPNKTGKRRYNGHLYKGHVYKKKSTAKRYC